MNATAQPDEWSILLNGMADEVLSIEQEQRLVELLQNNPQFRREYVRFCQLLTQLNWELSAEPAALPQPVEQTDSSCDDGSVRTNGPAQTTGSGQQTVRETWSRRTRAGWLTWSVTAVALVALAGWLSWWRSADMPPKQIVEVAAPGQVVSVSGEVAVVRGSHTPVWLDATDIRHRSQPLRRGDRVKTGRSSRAILTLADKTEIHLRPETELILFPDPHDGIDLVSGSISARVTQQSPQQPLTFVTQDSEVRVVGTELEVLSAAGRSEVAVTEGRVLVTRRSDGSSSEVSAGQFLSITESGPLSVIDWKQSADDWSIDFEEGLPSGWAGHLVRDGLPPGSRGAVAAVGTRRGDNPELQVRSPFQQSGLFAWHDDSVLRVTFKSQPPGWFHIYLFARPFDQRQPPQLYCCVAPDLWQSLPGQWRTVSIPLSEFRRQKPERDEPTLGHIPVQIFFSGESESGGFAIDRISVDRVSFDRLPADLSNRSTARIGDELRTTAGAR
ncbi:hypothetical protein GC176_21695 [bacterium]|nr:hypothetical protein [bacterium]